MLPRRADVPFFFLLGIVGYTVYHLALNFGQTQVSAGAASLIIATAPAITALLAVLMVGERLPVLGWVGSGVAFVGVALIVLGDSGDGLRFNAFAWLIVLAAVAVVPASCKAHVQPLPTHRWPRSLPGRACSRSCLVWRRT